MQERERPRAARREQVIDEGPREQKRGRAEPDHERTKPPFGEHRTRLESRQLVQPKRDRTEREQRELPGLGQHQIRRRHEQHARNRHEPERRTAASTYRAGA